MKFGVFFRGLLVIVVLAAPQVVAGQTFQPGDVFVVDEDGVNSRIFNITAGGDYSSATPLVVLPGTGAVWGEMCFSLDRTVMYVTEFLGDVVYEVTPSGAYTTFATGLQAVIEIECMRDGRVLAQEHDGGRVVDITAGGNFTGAPGFITHTGTMRGLTELRNGRLFVAAYHDGEVRIGNAGGSFSSLPLVATMGDVTQSVNEGLGNTVLVTTDGTGGPVWEVQTGTPVSFATGRSFLNTATNRVVGAVYATEFHSDQVFDITAGGNFSAASPFAFGFNHLDTAIAAVPPPGLVFADGFESGDSAAWTSTSP